jgi:anti-sigma factor RsiW
MSESHLRPADAELYVLGALEPQAATALEAHTLTCPSCATLLRREALLEEQLREVGQAAAQEARVLRPARWRHGPWSATAGALLATAATLALLVLRPEQATAPLPADDFPVMAQPMLELPEEPMRLVACPDLTSQEACASEALSRGLMVQYPQGVGQVPRYEGYAGLPQGAFNADGPHPL